MNREDLKRLQAYRGYPALSLRLPTHRAMPEAQQDPTRLKNVIRRAEHALKERGVEASVAQDYVARLEQFQRDLDYRHLEAGLEIFVGRGLFEAVLLPEPVDEAVVIGDSFLTRDLVRALNRQPRYFLLLLSEKGTRWFRGWGRQLREETGGAFPMSNDVNPDQPPEGFNKGVDPKRRANERIKVFMKHVADEAAVRLQGQSTPLFLAGVDRLRATYLEAAGQTSVAGVIEGNLDHSPVSAIAHAAIPAVEAWMSARRHEVLGRFESVNGTRHGASGLDETAYAAAMGRVDTLLLENPYAVAGSFDRQTGQLQHAEGNKADVASGDIVDEVVETVLERGGEVYFYSQGSLARTGARMAAILRF
jgi:hypothetical protein